MAIKIWYMNNKNTWKPEAAKAKTQNLTRKTQQEQNETDRTL